MRRVLILYPRAITFRYGRIGHYREMLRELGLEIVVGEHELDDFVRAHSDRVLELPPPSRMGEAWERVRAFLDRERVDAVLAQTESSLLVGALAARHAGLRGISPAAAHLCTNKLACRNVLELASVPQPRFALVRDAAGVRRFAYEHGFPVVLKGVASAAQRLVTLVRREDEIDRAVARVLNGIQRSEDIGRLVEFAHIERVELGCDPRQTFLVESFAEGDPLEVDGLALGERVECFGVTEQFHTANPNFFIEGYAFPADRPEPQAHALEEIARRALRALDVRDTGFSIELRARGDEARLIEVNGRLGVDEGFGDMFSAVIGFQPAFLALSHALGGPAEWTRGTQRAAVAYRCHYERGVVESVPPQGALTSADDSLTLALHVQAGEPVFAPGDARIRPHLAHALALDPGSSRAAYERARKAVDALALSVRSTKDDARSSGRSAGRARHGALEGTREFPQA